MSAVKCFVRNHVFVAVLAGCRTEQEKPECGFQHQVGENLFCFLFSDPIIVALTTICFPPLPTVLNLFVFKLQQISPNLKSADVSIRSVYLEG